MKFWKKLPLAVGVCLAVFRAPLTLAAPRDNGNGAPTGRLTQGPTTPAQPGGHAIPLSVTSDVAHQASIQAVLLPASLAQRIFGKEVAMHYAVVEVIISNRDSKASLIVQSIFLDYSKWALNGNGPDGNPLVPTDPDEKATQSSQVASVESRLVRGELLDAQQWTRRNWTMRALTALGTVAVGFEFPFTTDVNKGIGAFNGVVVPAAQALWPDGTIPQINRISDVGFQTNKVIPKESSDIVVAFFPIDRFLTKGFRHEFIHDTAAWFVPKEMLADPKTSKEFEKIVKPIAETIYGSGQDFRANMLKAMMTQNCAPASTDSSCRLLALLDGVSLNRIHVVLHGAMTIDQKTVPATVYSVDFKPAVDASVWTKTGTDQAGVIKGLFLSGTKLALVDTNGEDITAASLTPVKEGSNDTSLNFTMHLTGCIPSGTRVSLVVRRENKSDQGSVETVSSSPFELPVQPASGCDAALAATPTGSAAASENSTTASQGAQHP